MDLGFFFYEPGRGITIGSLASHTCAAQYMAAHIFYAIKSRSHFIKKNQDQKYSLPEKGSA